MRKRKKRLSNTDWIKNRIGKLILVCIVVGVIWVGAGMLYIVRNKTDTVHKEKYSLENVDETTLTEAAMEKANADYENGESGMRGDDEFMNIGNEYADAQEAPMMCQTLYDSDGNILWRGFTYSEYLARTDEDEQAFEKAYDISCNSALEESDDSHFKVDKKMDKADRLSALVTEYDELIPHAYKQFCYYKGFEKYEDGFDNTVYYQREQPGFGMSGIGYITWLYRNVLGYTPKALKGKKISESLMTPKSVQEIKIGDLCMAGTGENGIYGVVCGFYKSHPVVTVCTDQATAHMPCGCNHMVYIAMEHDEMLGMFPAVDFDRCYRLDEWED